MANIKTSPNIYHPLKLSIFPELNHYGFEALIKSQQNIVGKYIKEYSNWMKKELTGEAKQHSTGTARFNLMNAMQDLAFLYKKNENVKKYAEGTE